MKAGKVWGTTELIEANGALEFHRIEMNQGGVCSKHMHEFKWNGFFVESGSLLIRVWQRDYDLVDETIITAGQYTKVKPGLYHQFECIESGVAYELYWAEFNHNDIKRESVGYNDESKPELLNEDQTISGVPYTLGDALKREKELLSDRSAVWDNHYGRNMSTTITSSDPVVTVTLEDEN